MQFLEIRFQKTDADTFIYQHDGEPCVAGDIVEIRTRAGMVEVPVEAIATPQKYACTSIVRVMKRAAPAAADRDLFNG